MQKYEYKVMPLKAAVTPKDIEDQLASGKVAAQVELILKDRAIEGWEYFNSMEVDVEIQKGCGNLFDKGPNAIKLYQIIFRRPLK
jgi:hypothetical protein